MENLESVLYLFVECFLIEIEFETAWTHEFSLEFVIVYRDINIYIYAHWASWYNDIYRIIYVRVHVFNLASQINWINMELSRRPNGVLLS